MDVRPMPEQHLESGAGATVAAVPVPSTEARAFGVIDSDSAGRIIRFQEKPAAPAEMPGRPGHCLASMGNYIFETQGLLRELARDAEGEESAHDFGRNI